MLGALSLEDPLVFCGSEIRGTIGVEGSREEIHSADSTLRKKAYSRNFSQHGSFTTWTLYREAHSMVSRGGPRV